MEADSSAAQLGQGPTGRRRPATVLQIHPSLRCNLSCAHCYSSSGPDGDPGLDTQTVCRTISDAAALGYEAVSFSGGEPLMYAGLPEACEHAKSLGLVVTLTTNGFFLDAHHLDPIAASINGLAISLDGDAALHNATRGHPLAHERLARGLGYLRARGIRFGFIHTLTQKSWPMLEELVAFAADAGALLFQIHPLERAGRAARWEGGRCCDDVTNAKVFVLSKLLNIQYSGKPYVTVDLVHTATLTAHPELIYATECADDCPIAGSASELLRNLILESDGALVPFTYGIARSYAVTNVRQTPLLDAWPLYRAENYHHLRRLCRRVHRTLTLGEAPQLLNWYEYLRHESHAQVSA